MLAIRNTLQRASDQRGFTLVEVTIILLVLVILATIMLPQLGNFNRLARFVKVHEDLAAICATMKKFLDEVMVAGPFNQPGGGTTAPTEPIGLLVGPGLPPVSVVGSGANCSVGDWDNALSANGTATNITCTPDIVFGSAAATDFTTDDLRNHLQINDPFMDNSATASFRYKNQIETTSLTFFGWRGPYFDQVSDDPWGGRYMINTFGLHRATGGIFSDPVICFSAGPDQAADTLFSMGGQSNYLIGGDDIAVVLSAYGPF